MKTLLSCLAISLMACGGSKSVPDEGLVSVEGGQVWYRIVGSEAKGTPLLVLHGGPGGTYDYLLPLEALSDERPVVFYDQLGSGNSDHPEDSSLWSVERFAREVHTVRERLGLKRLHILGQSWGAALAVEYVGRFGEDGVESLILSGPYLDTALWERDARNYIDQLPAAMREEILLGEATGAFSSQGYQDAMTEYYSRHLCRLPAWPEELTRTFNKLGLAVYSHMWGPSEFTVTGTLKNFTVIPRLERLEVPVLLTAGEYDEASPESVRYFQSITKNSRAVIFSDAAHEHHLEKREEYLQAVRTFLGEQN